MAPDIPVSVPVKDPVVAAPAGTAHVASPRQNVDDDALVPLLRLATGKLPVTSALRLTALHVLFPCRSVFAVADPEPRRAVSTVPLVRSAALLILVPETVVVPFSATVLENVCVPSHVGEML